MAAPQSPIKDYPLSGELDLMNYLRQITGNSTTGTYQASQAVAGQAPELTTEKMQGIMTEWLRGNGRFLENMQQQNQSGLYNSSTRRLVANDLTAQAALKAATANQDTQKLNAQLQTEASIKNAQLQTQAAKDSSTQISGKTAKQNLAGAAGIAALAAIMKAFGDSGGGGGGGGSGSKGANGNKKRPLQLPKKDAVSPDTSEVADTVGTSGWDLPTATIADMQEVQQMSFSPQYAEMLQTTPLGQIMMQNPQFQPINQSQVDFGTYNPIDIGNWNQNVGTNFDAGSFMTDIPDLGGFDFTLNQDWNIPQQDQWQPDEWVSDTNNDLGW